MYVCMLKKFARNFETATFTYFETYPKSRLALFNDCISFFVFVFCM